MTGEAITMADCVQLPTVQDRTGIVSVREWYPATWRAILFRLSTDSSTQNHRSGRNVFQS